MGDFTKKLIGSQRKSVLRRKNGPDVDLVEFRSKTPTDALQLLSDETRADLDHLNADSKQEIGQTLLGFADALSRVVPPSIRIDLFMGQSGWISEITANGEKLARRTANNAVDLAVLVADSAGCLARYAADSVPDDTPLREVLQSEIYRSWARRMQNVSVQLDALADLSLPQPPPEPEPDAKSDHRQ